VERSARQDFNVIPKDREQIMRLHLTAGIAAALLVTSIAAAEARSWNRSGTNIGPRGTSSYGVTGQCSGGTCTRNATRTGPYGNTATRTGTVTRTAPGSFQGSRTTTGPGGRSVTRSGTLTVQ
jgi:hypothetical protein